jgi:hypothetical protein
MEGMASADLSGIPAPTAPKYLQNPTPLKLVTEDFGWDSLSEAEINEYLEAEAYSAHIGQFIHKGSSLDKLREELPFVPTVNWMELTKDVKTPIDITVHHTSTQLHQLHESLAELHRKYEQRVNYFKAKVKNITTIENSNRSKEYSKAVAEVDNKNAELRAKYESEITIYRDKCTAAQNLVADIKHDKVKAIAAMRINVDPRFQAVVDRFKPKDQAEE